MDEKVMDYTESPTTTDGDSETIDVDEDFEEPSDLQEDEIAFIRQYYIDAFISALVGADSCIDLEDYYLQKMDRQQLDQEFLIRPNTFFYQMGKFGNNPSALVVINADQFITQLINVYAAVPCKLNFALDLENNQIQCEVQMTEMEPRVYNLSHENGVRELATTLLNNLHQDIEPDVLVNSIEALEHNQILQEQGSLIADASALEVKKWLDDLHVQSERERYKSEYLDALIQAITGKEGVISLDVFKPIVLRLEGIAHQAIHNDCLYIYGPDNQNISSICGSFSAVDAIMELVKFPNNDLNFVVKDDVVQAVLSVIGSVDDVKYYNLSTEEGVKALREEFAQHLDPDLTELDFQIGADELQRRQHIFREFPLVVQYATAVAQLLKNQARGMIDNDIDSALVEYYRDQIIMDEVLANNILNFAVEGDDDVLLKHVKEDGTIALTEIGEDDQALKAAIGAMSDVVEINRPAVITNDAHIFTSLESNILVDLNNKLAGFSDKIVRVARGIIAFISKKKRKLHEQEQVNLALQQEVVQENSNKATFVLK